MTIDGNLSEYKPGDPIEYLLYGKWHPAIYVEQGKNGVVIYPRPMPQAAESLKIRRALTKFDPDDLRPPTPVGWSDTDWLAHLEQWQREQEIPYARGPLPERGWD